jgi:adenosylcobinamide kinase/adenosylcobinamide-phosphate guanylyltransferase
MFTHVAFCLASRDLGANLTVIFQESNIVKRSLPPLTLVFGGAASGKSAFAEGLVVDTGLPRSYVATAQAFDGEMAAKIAQHQVDRGSNWTTHEAPTNAPEVLSQISTDRVILLDCMTMWLSNVMLQDGDTSVIVPTMLDAISGRDGPVVAVSNETGMGVVPDTALGRAFRDQQGRLNQQLAARADLVVFVAAGLPLVLKGQLP